MDAGTAELRRRSYERASGPVPEGRLEAMAPEDSDDDGSHRAYFQQWGRYPVSQIANIDLEPDMVSKAVLQIGIVDLEGQKVVDCLSSLRPRLSLLPRLFLHRPLIGK